MHDIKPKEKRSIRNITLSGNRRTTRVSPAPVKRDDSTAPSPRKTTPYRERKEGGGKKIFFAIVILCVLVLGAGGLMTLFGKTTVVITPKTIEAQINSTVTAAETGSAATTSVLYQNISLDKTLSKDVPATDERYVEEKAQGTIIVYNSFDENPQRLITNTRFRASDGLIYRIRESIVVPGQKTENGQVTPGSIEVTVYADEAGENYNKNQADFTIPGFEGDPRYDKFYARTKTAIIGGYVGNKKQVAEGVLTEATKELDTTLRANLLSELGAQIPNNLTILEGLVTFTFEDVPQETSGEMVKITRKGVITAPLFDKQNLAQELASQNNIPTDAPMVIDSYTTFTITPVEEEGTEAQLDFGITGSAKFIGIIDEVSVQGALAGKAKSELAVILASFPGIDSARATISPFWIKSFPENAEEIEIIIERP